MIDFIYLKQGVYGLANAHRANAMAGHLGAAVAAGYLFGEDQHGLEAAVFDGIRGELDRILHGDEAIWFNAETAGITIPDLFQPLPDEPGNKDLVAQIPQALSANIDATRQSGHNVIFAAIAVRALRDHPELATPSIVAGITRLIQQFNGAVAGRGYYGKQQGWLRGNQVTPPADDKLPAYRDLSDMANVVCDHLIQTASIHRQGFGGLWHVINHAAGLIELALYGHRDLAHKGLAAHHYHLRLYRALPDVGEELGPIKKADHDPRTAAFWQTGSLKRDQARLTHRIKTLYGFFRVAELVEDADRRRQAEDSLRYLMA